MKTDRSWSNGLIDTPVNRSTHIGKGFTKLLPQLHVIVVTDLVEEEGSLNSSKLLGGPFTKQVIQETY